MNDYFIAVYTHECKSCCDNKFFNRLTMIGGDVHVVDNSDDTWYYDRLRKMVGFASVEHLDVEADDHGFLRRVTESVKRLQEKFLETDKGAFVILESDVLAPRNLLSLFEEVRGKADIIGGIYYRGFHNDKWFVPGYEKLVEAKTRLVWLHIV